MTRPIFEPSTARTEAKLGFGSDQLFRRPAPISGGGYIPWIRLKQININQTFAADDCATIIYDDVCNNYPDTFDTYIETPEIWGVNILEPGLYQMTVRVSIDDFNIPTSGFTLDIYNADWDLAYPYSTFVAGYNCPQTTVGVPFNKTLAGYSELTFRMDSTDKFNDPTELNVKICTCTDGFDLFNAYLEVRKLGTATVPDGLDNLNLECGS